MKRLFVSAALVPLLHAAAAQAETKISTATATPARTSTAAAGQPDSLTIEQAGSIKPTAAGAAVTIDSDHAVKNLGTIAFEDVDDAAGVLLQGGRTAAFTNSGAISVVEDYVAQDADQDGDLDGPFAEGSGRFGVRLAGAAPFTGDIRNEGAITVEGNHSGGVALQARLNGAFAHSGSISVIGDGAHGVIASSVAGDLRITGTITARGEGVSALVLGDVDGVVHLQNTLSATGYRSAERLSDAARAKLDADDLKQGGAAVRITGDVGEGVLLDRPPADASADDQDEDDDGVADAQEGRAVLLSIGSAPALDIGSGTATHIGAVGTGDYAYGLVNRGEISASGLNDGVAATALRVGQAGGGAVTLAGGLNNLGGTVLARAHDAQATGVLLNAGAVAPVLRNTGSITADQSGGAHDARAVVDLSGGLGRVENLGVIRATVTPKGGEAPAGRAVALDLSANATGAVVRQSKIAGDSKPAIEGDVRFGSGADRLELLGGSLTGALSFGAGADVLVIDGAATATGRLSDADGRLSLDIRDGVLAVANVETLQLSALSLGEKGVLAVAIDPAANAATRFRVSGAATLAGGAQIDLKVTSLVKTAASYEVIRAGTLVMGAAGARLVGAPYLYVAELRADAAEGVVLADIRPKTAQELGLSRSGGQAYSAVFDVLDRDERIEAAFLGQKTREGFMGLYDQMLPDHSGGALMSAAAISGAVSQAVGRRPAHDGHGGKAVWAQEILFHIERDRDQAVGFKAQGFGLAAGVEAVGEGNALGLNASFVSADYRDRNAAAGEEVAMRFAETGLYWRTQAAGLQAVVRGGLGYVWFEGDRHLAGSGLDLSAKADWSGWIADAHAGLSYEVRLGRFYARPELSVDYLRLSEDGYQETGGGDAFDLTVEDRKGDLLTGQALLALGWEFGDEAWWRPEVKVGWRENLAGDPGRTTARFKGGPAFTLDPEEPWSGGAVARLGVQGGTGQIFFGADAGAAIDDGYEEIDVRAMIRLRF